ncbi:MAG TPA: GyrI-like domain-containing protein [Anaerovoracaceae bacterium]|nr:GyrI-like domain-containing protein [Anaerovoracaceae bacterium]
MEAEKLDFKKEYKDLYMPAAKPSVIDVPAMNFIMVDGKGDPNAEGGEYQQAVELLYALSYTIKMGYKKIDKPEGYTDYVVAPLEGLWWLEDGAFDGFDFSALSQKDKYFWTSMIRQPDFVTGEVFERACKEVAKKKPGLDPAKARLEVFEERLCVQAMHLGPYSGEPETIAQMEAFIEANGYRNAINDQRLDGTVKRHHEIYLGDPRKTDPSKLKTVLRHPVK